MISFWFIPGTATLFAAILFFFYPPMNKGTHRTGSIAFLAFAVGAVVTHYL